MRMVASLAAWALFGFVSYASAHDLGGTWVGTQNQSNLRLNLTNDGGRAFSGTETGVGSSVVRHGRVDRQSVTFVRHNNELQYPQFFSGVLEDGEMYGSFCHHDPRHGWSCNFEWWAKKQ